MDFMEGWPEEILAICSNVGHIVKIFAPVKTEHWTKTELFGLSSPVNMVVAQ